METEYLLLPQLRLRLGKYKAVKQCIISTLPNPPKSKINQTIRHVGLGRNAFILIVINAANDL